MNRTPIVVALDVTRLRGNDSKIVYQKLPTFIGMIEIKGYVGGAMISAGIGDDVADDIDSKEICAGLQQKYQVFFIYLQKGFEDRKADIDAAIQQRVEAVGGQYPNVDVRASLIWNNRNDLDLHVIAPYDEEIYYAHKQSACKGWRRYERVRRDDEARRERAPVRGRGAFGKVHGLRAERSFS